MRLKKNLDLISFEGIFSSLQLNLTVPFLIAFLVLLNATVFEIAFFLALTSFFSIIGGLPAAWLIEKNKNIKKLFLISSISYKLLWIPLALIPFILTDWFIPFTLIAGIAYFLSSFSLIAWSTWMGRIVPKKIRGAFFAKRNLLVSIFALIALFFAVIFLDFFSENELLGVQLLFFFSIIFAVISFILMRKVNRSNFPVLKEKNNFFQAIKYVIEEKGFKEFILFMLLMNLGIYIILPFWDSFVLNDLNLSASIIPFLALSVGLGTILTMKVWGNLNDLYGSKIILFVSTLIIAIHPLFWLIASTPLELFLANFVFGLFWNGFLLSSFNYQLDLTPATKRAKYLSLFALFTGFPLIFAPFIGSMILNFFSINSFGLNLNPFHWLLLISSFLRVLPLILIGGLKEPRKYRIQVQKVFGSLVFGTVGQWQNTVFNVIHISNPFEIKKIFLNRTKKRLLFEKQKSMLFLNWLYLQGKSLSNTTKNFFNNSFGLLFFDLNKENEKKLLFQKNFFNFINGVNKKIDSVKKNRKKTGKKLIKN